MSEFENTRREDEAMRKLLADAGPRPSIPDDDLAAITEAARATWRRRYGDGRAPGRSRWWIGLAAAAVLAAALGLTGWLRTLEPPPAEPLVASVEVLTGEVRIWGPGGEGPVPLPAGALGRPLPAGAELETGEAGRLALRMVGGDSVRLDTGTRIRLAGKKSVDLARGAVYVDSVGAMAVQAPNGFFQDIGTRFEVRIEGEGEQAATRLRVREGRVMLLRPDRPVVAGIGEELTVHADHNITRRGTAVYGREWDWVLQTAPRLDIEGVKVRAYLDWLGRETGWQIEFADPEAAALAESTVLHGSIEHLAPAATPDVVLASCGLGYRVSGGRMVMFVTDEAH